MKQESELRLFEDASNPYLLVDGEGKIVWHNQAARQFFSMLGQRSSPTDIYQIFEPSQIKTILSTEHYSTLDLEFAGAAGAPIRQALLVVDLSGGNPDSQIFVLSFFSRESERSEINQRAQFLESVAHDLKNPLGAIFGYADALLDTSVGSGMNDTQIQVTRRIRNTALRCIEMVRNYQQLLELESEALLPASASLNFNAIIDGVIAQLWRPGGDSASVVVELAQPAPLIKGRRVQVERVVANLFGNALKYTPADQIITIRNWVDGGMAYLVVHNSGSFIAAEDLAGLFDRYTRAKSSGDSSGTGIGLHIVKQVIKRLGGQCDVSSSVADGTCFTVSFPLG